MVGDMSRPIGGAGPQGAAFYSPGVADTSGGYYANAPGLQGLSMGGYAGPSSRAIASGYGHDLDGDYNPSFATSTQYGAGGYDSGYRPEADYSGGMGQYYDNGGYGGKSTTTY
jgi:hypothetical protein